MNFVIEHVGRRTKSSYSLYSTCCKMNGLESTFFPSLVADKSKTIINICICGIDEVKEEVELIAHVFESATQYKLYSFKVYLTMGIPTNIPCSIRLERNNVFFIASDAKLHQSTVTMSLVDD